MKKLKNTAYKIYHIVLDTVSQSSTLTMAKITEKNYKELDID